jgi:hypothetical protein
MSWNRTSYESKNTFRDQIEIMGTCKVFLECLCAQDLFVLGALGFNSTVFSGHYDMRPRKGSLFSASAKAGVQVVTARETDVLTFGNSQLFVYQDADGNNHVKLRQFRDDSWSALIDLY